MAVKKNDILELKIVDLGSHGEGIGKHNNFTIFVDGGVPGDKVKVKINLKKKNYAKGEVVEIVEKADIRTTPKCPYFNVCGGCQIQNINYHEQLKLKKNQLENTIRRIGKIDKFTIKDTIGMENPYFYRNKGQFPLEKKDKKVSIGFYQIGTHDVVDIDNCITQDYVANKVIKVIRTIANEKELSIYDEKTYRGILRHVVVRTSHKTKDTMVILVTKGDKLPEEKLFIEKLSKLPEIRSIYQNINNTKGNRILSTRNNLLWGEERIIDYLEELKFEISPLSFFQINSQQTEKLYNKVLDFAKLQPDDIVYDLYCGIGSISLFLAKKAKKVIGVEIIEPAVIDARKNAKNNKLNNIEFIVGKAEVEVPKLYKQGKTADVVVVDPPRKGCDQKLLETMIEMDPRKIVYVSCKPSTLARDLKYLTHHGYTVEKVQPVDMFPQTIHVETVVLLKKL